MRLPVTVLVLALSAPVAAAAADPKEAAKKLEGTYDILDVIAGGKPDPKKDETRGRNSPSTRARRPRRSTSCPATGRNSRGFTT
jgi:hypothetical protein